MTDEERYRRMSANAAMVLWCVHVLGPDDVYAAPSYVEAVARAAEMNDAIHQRSDAPDDVLCFAYAAPWPHDPASHAESVKEWTP